MEQLKSQIKEPEVDMAGHIARTRSLWCKKFGRILTVDEAKEIIHNVGRLLSETRKHLRDRRNGKK